tara:strand:+ start:2442 stop:2663 length:222 start_codon:yes stop_codon:yes gene_type:complete
MITGPVAYYKEMGFTSLDSIVYSTALIGSLGGLLGIAQGIRFGKFNQIVAFGIMTCGSLYGAKKGLDIANLNY